MAQGDRRPLGRPRDAATDAAIVRAAVELVGEVGATRTTLAAVARRAGVARATVYLRWPNRSALIGAAAREAVGGQVMPLSGDLEFDIRYAARFIARIAGAATFQQMLPEMVRGLLAMPQELAFDSLAPQRRGFAREYELLADAQGLDTTVAPTLVFDVLLGAAIDYILANRRAMSEGDMSKLGEVLIRGLRVPAGP